MPPTKEQAQVGQLGGGVESENSIDEKEEKELSRNLVQMLLWSIEFFRRVVLNRMAFAGAGSGRGK